MSFHIAMRATSLGYISPVAGPRVSSCVSTRGWVGDVLRGFKRTLVLKVRGDAGCTESVVPNPGLDAAAELQTQPLGPLGGEAAHCELSGVCSRPWILKELTGGKPCRAV